MPKHRATPSKEIKRVWDMEEVCVAFLLPTKYFPRQLRWMSSLLGGESAASRGRPWPNDLAELLVLADGGAHERLAFTRKA